MAYCRFQNTLQDLRYCIEAIESANDLDEMDLSMTEQQAMNSLNDLCADYRIAFKSISIEF